MSYISGRGQAGPIPLQQNGTFQQYVPTSTSDTSQNTILGTRWDLEDGRELVYVLAGASNLASGLLMQDAALIANHQGLVTTAFTAYSNNGNQPAQVTVTLGGTAVTANEYALGYAVVISGTGLGQTLQIASHPAQATTTGNVVLTLADAPNIALDTTSVISLVFQPGNGVIINPTTPTNKPRGVTLYPITAGDYGYLVAKGTTACRSDASTASVGQAISPSTTTAGDITVFATNTAVIGQAIIGTTSAQYKPVAIDL